MRESIIPTHLANCARPDSGTDRFRTSSTSQFTLTTKPFIFGLASWLDCGPSISACAACTYARMRMHSLAVHHHHHITQTADGFTHVTTKAKLHIFTALFRAHSLMHVTACLARVQVVAAGAADGFESMLVSRQQFLEFCSVCCQSDSFSDGATNHVS